MRRIWILTAVLMCVTACNAKNEQPRPSGLKNMAPPSIKESVQEGLDVEPNNTFVQATDLTLTSDVFQWAGTLENGDVDVWRLKAKAGTICDISVIPEGDVDVVADFSNTNNEQNRHYHDSGLAGQPEMLTNIRLTPQGGYLTIRARQHEDGQVVKYRVMVSRVFASEDGNLVEAEPNDEKNEAMQVNSRSKVEGVLYPRGDVDYYQVTLEAASKIAFNMPDGANEVVIEQDNKVIWTWDPKAGKQVESDILTPDMRNLVVRFKSLGDLKEPIHYSFAVQPLEKVPDEIEPNNTIEKAQTIQVDSQNLEFSLLDDADIDIFRVNVDPEKVYRARLVGPQAGQAKLQVLSSNGTIRTDVRMDQTVVCDTNITEQNSMWLRVSPGTAAYPLTYHIAIDAVSADSVEKEPNQTSGEANDIEPGMIRYGHIFPADDIDVYRIKLPSYPGVDGPIGKLNVDIEGGYVASLLLQLQDQEGYEITQKQNEQYSRPMRLTFDAPNGEYYLKITGGGDGCMKPYVLKVNFEPNERAIQSLTALAGAGDNAGNMADPGNPANPVIPADPALAPANDKVDLKVDAVDSPVDVPIDELIQAAQGNVAAPKPNNNPDEDDDSF